MKIGSIISVDGKLSIIIKRVDKKCPKCYRDEMNGEACDNKYYCCYHPAILYHIGKECKCLPEKDIDINIKVICE